MGCAPLTTQHQNASLQIIRKIIPKMVRSETQNSNNNSSLSRIPSGQQPACLKIKIIAESNKVICNSLNLSGTQIYMASLEYIPDYNLIRQLYVNYQSEFRSFCNLVHETCFHGFEITDGLFVMLISIFANKTAEVKFIQKAPFIEITGSLHEDSKLIFDSWLRLSSLINMIANEQHNKIKKCTQRLKMFIVLLVEHSEYNLRPEKLQKAITLSNSAIDITGELTEVAQQYYSKSNVFFQSMRKKLKEVRKISERANLAGVYSGERIVHTILTN